MGPVTRMIPFGSLIILPQRSRSSAVNPSSTKSRTSTSGVKIRITTFSPNAVGIVEIRSSTSSPAGVTVLIRPSCGRRFSTISIRASSLMREVIATRTGVGIAYTWCSTPSMRKRTMPASRRGSMWMSEARCSNAYCQSQSTMWTTWLSLASSFPCWPSATSCSKSRASDTSPFEVSCAFFIERARL